MHGGERHAIEQALSKPDREALRRAGRQADILVHVERRDAAPVDIGLGDQRLDHVGLAGSSSENHPHTGGAGQPGADLRGNVAAPPAPPSPGRVAKEYTRKRSTVL